VKLTKPSKKENIEKEREIERKRRKKEKDRVPRKTSGRNGGRSKSKPDS
jgi:hypothetical protein